MEAQTHGVIAVNEVWQQRENRREAQRTLAAMKAAERIAASFETLWTRCELSDARIGYLRGIRSEQYRQLTGIELNERHIVRPLLENLAATGETTVAQLLSDFRGRLRNGSLTGTAGASTSASGSAN